MPKEIIIVDDCSTDNSRRIIEKLAKENETIKLIYPKTNGGVSKARNLGLQNASYDYVTFIDSDDFYINVGKLKNEMKQLKLLEEKGYQGLAYSTTVLVDEDGKVIPCRANRRRRKNEFMKGNRVLKTLISLFLYGISNHLPVHDPPRTTNPSHSLPFHTPEVVYYDEYCL